MEIEKQLNILWDKGELPHAVLFVGQNSDTARLVTELSQKILNTENLSAHPDFVHIDSHKVEDVRDLMSILALRSFGNRVVLLDAGEELTATSVNSLLKKLEEPPADTYFIVATSHEEKLLPTLRSRLTPFRISSGKPEKNEAVDEFTNATDLSKRLDAIRKLDMESADLDLFLRQLYKNEIKKFNPRSVLRLPHLLKVFEFLSSNVSPQRALAYLAVHW